jgi:UDP-galactopyranose mutase
MIRADYIVVGAGLTGATIARLLADAGREVLLLDRRADVGGNVHDHLHPSGVRIHTYGPHYFRTASKRIWSFATRFARFYPFEAHILSSIDGTNEHWPILRSYLEKAVGSDWKPSFTGRPNNFEEASLSMMPALVYNKFVKAYTEKQWGLPAIELEPSLARRFSIRNNGDTRLSQHLYQGLPAPGYAAWMRSLVDGIPLSLNMDYLKHREFFRANKRLIYTGPIDELFGFALGKLKYRSQRRSHTYVRDRSYVLPCCQVNNPSPQTGPHIRTIEWKHLMQPAEADAITGTVLTTETPFTPSNTDAYEYPFPDSANAALYARYRRLADSCERLLVCGRLGEYRYYDMDQAIGRAMKLAETLGVTARSQTVMSVGPSDQNLGRAL